MDRETEGWRPPESSVRALIRWGFSHQPQESGACSSGGAAVFKTTPLSKINRRRFTFQSTIQSRAAPQLTVDLMLLTAVKAQGFVGSEREYRECVCGVLTR